MFRAVAQSEARAYGADMRSVLVLAMVFAGLLAVAPVSEAARTSAHTLPKPSPCKNGKVAVTVGSKTTCKPLGKAIPKPKALDFRLAHLQEALAIDPAASLKGKKRRKTRTLQSGFGAAGKRARKKIAKVLPKVLAFIDRKRGASSSTAHASGGCGPGPAGPTGQTGGASMGTLGDTGGYIDAEAGGGLRVKVTFYDCAGVGHFNLPECPTAAGAVDGKGSSEFHATIEIWQRDQFVSRSSTVFEQKGKLHGEVGPDAKLKQIDVDHTEEVFIVASGGVVVRGGVTRTVRIAMPGGRYDPSAARVRFYGDSIDAATGAKAFAATVASALSSFQSVEPKWSSFPPKCAETVFAPVKDSVKLKKGESGRLSVFVKSKADGGRAAAARWSFVDPLNAEFSPSSSEAPAADVTYKVTSAAPGAKAEVTARFTSTAGVGEGRWTQPIEDTGVNEISGTFTQVTEQGGGVFTVAGTATYERLTPPFLSPVEGSFGLVQGLYTFTASGKASFSTPLCSMQGSGQFAVHKESQFTVLSENFDGKPPYTYSFEVASENQPSLPMIDITLFDCAHPAEELEGEVIEYPAAMAIVTDGLQVSPDGITYAGSFEETFPNYRFANSWNFVGKE